MERRKQRQYRDDVEANKAGDADDEEEAEVDN
jgi:hypothetical protein